MLGGNPILFLFLLFCSCFSINTHYYFCNNCVSVFQLVFEPSKTFGWLTVIVVLILMKNKNFCTQYIFWEITEAWFWAELFTQDLYTNFQGFLIFSEFLELHKYTKFIDCYRLFCFWQIMFSMCCLLILMNLWVVSGGMNHGEVGI